MALAAALCVLGLENKVQAILLIGALPLLVLPFGGAESASVAFWRIRDRAGCMAGIAGHRGHCSGMGRVAADRDRL